MYSNPAKYEKEFKDIKTTDAHGHKHTRDPAILYRRIFGISRHVTIEYLGVWVSPDLIKLTIGYRVEPEYVSPKVANNSRIRRCRSPLCSRRVYRQYLPPSPCS